MIEKTKLKIFYGLPMDVENQYNVWIKENPKVKIQKVLDHVVSTGQALIVSLLIFYEG